MIRALLFDLDETLIDRNETMRRFLVGQHQRFPALHIRDCTEFIEACLRHQENGYADKYQAYKLACSGFGPSTLSLVDQLFEDFKAHYGKEPVLFPKVLETMTDLQKRYLIGLVSNGRTKGQTAKIEASGIGKFFSSICISESIGSKKPDHLIFMKCLEGLSVQPSEAVFIGDNPARDIEPAKSLGMRAVWRRNQFFAEPLLCDGVYSNIDELPGLLGNIS